jgi:hypothetical protein
LASKHTTTSFWRRRNTENVERGFKTASKLGLKILEASLEGLIKGLLKTMGPERLSLFIENDWNILGSVFYGLYRPPIEAYQKMTPEEIVKVERVRRNLARTVLPVIGMARRMAASFPASTVEAKVTADWLMEKGEKYFPEIMAVIKQHGDRGNDWVHKQAQEIREFLTGKIVYHPQRLCFVKVEELNAEIAEKK